MRRRALDWVWENQQRAPGLCLVLLAVVEHADGHGETCIAPLCWRLQMTSAAGEAPANGAAAAPGSAAPGGVTKCESGAGR
jgi:hypothetical protein